MVDLAGSYGGWLVAPGHYTQSAPLIHAQGVLSVFWVTLSGASPVRTTVGLLGALPVGFRTCLVW